ncbi:hypothetical protein G352_17114 [Rhodococcus ruber BKS 20-38]|uniref:DUF5709 domain-containing protein n=3 Tax=Nocardiaceae TaxID=85025 RepID=M2YKH2_9NOCA|nr:hypothetical protein G352_17114 [Rhodococcus ruber BKS 20-38]
MDSWRADGTGGIVWGMPTSENPGDSVPGEYSVDDEDQLQPEDSLIDRGVDDVLDEGFSPMERPVGLDRHETLDERLREEEPEREDEGESEFRSSVAEAGRARAGRLVAPDEGTAEDQDAELFGTDVGIDGGAASAEEAAVHLIDEEDSGRED